MLTVRASIIIHELWLILFPKSGTNPYDRRQFKGWNSIGLIISKCCTLFRPEITMNTGLNVKGATNKKLIADSNTHII
jgi:hypothetical protein